ncbi:hypothetical protein AWZ03_006515 [Drosophila navojoa]|uniref:Uncharacterized protein n=1 Tax=Drosophila navojoa TaxID=7232 RepID=A0A484BEC0_DRONA|nr:hypothetical protein AWZ03_006515 [Drosophila navojoa]
MSSNVDCIKQQQQQEQEQEQEQQDAWQQQQQQQQQQQPQHRRRGRWPTSATVCRIVFLAATCQRVDLLPLPLPLPLPPWHTHNWSTRPSRQPERPPGSCAACGMWHAAPTSATPPRPICSLCAARRPQFVGQWSNL